MNVSPQTFILFSLGTDVLLCLVLVFLWWRHSDEQHALAWAGGQLALTAGTVVWFLGSPEWPRQALAAATLTASVAGFWAGTEIFLGNFTRKHLRRAVLAFVLAGGAVYLLWRSMPQVIQHGTAAVYGLTFLWVGYRLVSNRNHYRLLGLVLIARGAFNLVNSFGVVPPVFELWFIFSFLIKSASMLCLIHAVQEKIQKRYTRAIDSLTKGFAVYDREGIIRSANLRCARLLGCPSVEKLVGTHAADWSSAVTRDMVAGHFARFAAARRYPYLETMVFGNADGQLPVELIASPHYERGQLHCMMLVMDITERKKKDDELYRAAHYDSITGLLNRHGLSLELAALLARVDTSGVDTSGVDTSGVDTSGANASARQEGAVLFIDLDKFKRVNDSFGHAVGDQLLRQIAGLLQSALGPQDLLARFGGDEFIVVLPAAPGGTSALAQASALGERILHTLGNGFQLSPQQITLSASIGVACYPADGGDADTLIRNAEIAMHDVKHSGRGTLRCFNSTMSAYAREALVIDGALRSAIHADELQLVFQPITNAASGQLDKVEALLRWHSATLGVIGPDRFIPVAEDSGLIIELGAWVLDSACRQLAAWDDSLPALVVSINVSARQLLDPGFVVLVEQALVSNRLAPQRLELELTERVLIGDGEQVRGVLAHLRELGVSISLDDFGTGYSSLSYLTHFQINTLKIDRAFVTDMVDSTRSRALVGTIIAMGHSLGLQLVAEGVETADQAQALQAMGCHYLQGYHISRPLDALALPQFAVKT